jgi:hypothetical protein
MVAIDGDTIVVGSWRDDAAGFDSGSAYVFVRSGSSWTQQAKLVGSNTDGGDLFGHAVDIDGETIVVGAVFHSTAYVFVRSGSTWTEQAILTQSDSAGGYFGGNLDLEGDTAVVTAWLNGAGSAYVYVRSGSTWTEQVKLTASDGSSLDRFGRGVALEGDTLMIGANSDDDLGTDAGSLYVFKRSGTTWNQQQKLTPSDGAANDWFGGTISLSGDTALIGAMGDDDWGSQSGSVYVFVNSGTTWIEQTKLTASDGAVDDLFGNSLSISGNTYFVGARWDDDGGTNSGSVYVYDLGLAINTNELPETIVGKFASDTIEAIQGTPPYSFSIVSGALPNGMSLDSSGFLSGTPTVEGTFSFTVRVTDANSDTADRVLIKKIVSCAQIPSDIVSWWPGDGNSDDIIDGNDGTLLNGATYAAGKVGQAFSFDGINDYVSIGNMGSFPITGAIEFWMNPSVVENHRDPFTTNYNGYNAAIRFEEHSSVLGHTNSFAFAIGNDDQSIVKWWFMASDQLGNPIQANNWYHVGLTWDTTTNNVKAYMDGTLVVDDFTTGWPTSLPNVAIGSGFTTISSRQWKGLVDEVGIYDRVLTDTEIGAIFNAGSAGKCSPVTPDGPTVVIHPDPDVLMTFNYVDTPGTTTVTTTDTNPGDELANFKFVGTFYDITTTASYTGDITICLFYNEADVTGQEENIKIFHWENGAYVKLTSTIVYPDIDKACATVTSLSPFVIGYEVTPVEIDIKPGSDPNSINLGSEGNVPIAIMTTADFDATNVDPETVSLAGASVGLKGKSNKLMASIKDVDGDGDDDLMLHIDIEEMDLMEGSSVAVLYGSTYDDIEIKGIDSVNIVPP